MIPILPESLHGKQNTLNGRHPVISRQAGNRKKKKGG
jgi:hypothetical protein